MLSTADRFYVHHNNSILTASSIAELLKQLPRAPSFNHRYLSDYFRHVFFASNDNIFETIFEGVYRIPIGYSLLVKKGKASVVRIWSLKDSYNHESMLSFSEALTQFEEKLLSSVAEVVPKTGKVGVELSGGLDSSTVAALTRKLLPKSEINAFTHGVPSPLPDWVEKSSGLLSEKYQQILYDESSWSQEVAEFLDLKQHISTEPCDFHERLEHYTETLGSFTEVLFPLLNYPHYELAKSLGVKTLLSGFGGDEVVSQSAGVYLKELEKNGPSYRLFYEKLRSKKLRTYLAQAFSSKIKASREKNEALSYLKLEVEREGYNPLSVHQSVRSREFDYIEGQFSLHWQRRIETSQIIAHSYGLNYEFPLARPELMTFFHSLPASYKYRHGKGRYLFRRVMERVLPSKVAWRKDKAGTTAPASNIYLTHQLPEIFLSRISEDYKGVLVDYIDIPKLMKRLESGPIVQAQMVRLLITVLMIAHLEKQLSWKFFKSSKKEAHA